MKIWMYQGGMKLVSKSGIARAYEHQKEALCEKQIEYVTKFCLDYDILQINTVFPDSFLVALLGKVMKKKVVYYAHSTMEDFKKSFKGSDTLAPLFKKWIKMCYTKGDIIITPTPYSKKLLKSYGIATEIISLSNGIDLNFFQRKAEYGERFRETYHFGENEKIILSVGHYIERKGIEDFADLAKRMPEFQFVWLGYTNFNLIPDKIRKIIQQDLPNLHFPGYVTREEIREAYCGCNLFLFLTQEETEGIVLLEALAMKTPILVRDIPIYESWLENGKEIYKGKNLNEFESSIRDIINEKAPVLTEEGYLKVSRCNFTQVGNTLCDIYTSLITPQPEISMIREPIR